MEYGVNHRSILMDLEYFDLCSGALVQDAMHDLMEGVLQYETKLLLCHYIDNGNFTLQNLNILKFAVTWNQIGLLPLKQKHFAQKETYSSKKV